MVIYVHSEDSVGSVGFKCRDEVNLNQVERTLPSGKNGGAATSRFSLIFISYPVFQVTFIKLNI